MKYKLTSVIMSLNLMLIAIFTPTVNVNANIASGPAVKIDEQTTEVDSVIEKTTESTTQPTTQPTTEQSTVQTTTETSTEATTESNPTTEQAESTKTFKERYDELGKDPSFSKKPDPIGFLEDEKGFKSELPSTAGIATCTLQDITFDNRLNMVTTDIKKLNTVKMIEHINKLNEIFETEIEIYIDNNKIEFDKQVLYDAVNKETGEINRDILWNWCHALYERYNTQDREREFKTWNGNTVQVPAGDYGHRCDLTGLTDRMCEALQNREDFKEEHETDNTYTYNGSDQIGDTYVECDLTNQKVFFYRNGECVLSSDCVTGQKAAPTPVGVFTIKCNNGRTRLRGSALGSSWDIYVNYWAHFYNGCGLHDATWQSSFGLNRWQSGYGSHGCINLPLNVAEAMGQYIDVGEPIVIYYNK